MARVRAGVREALDGIQVGDEVIVLTWLDRARRDVLQRPPARRPVAAAAGRLHHPLAGPPEPDRPAPGRGRGDRGRPRPRPQPRGRRRHADPRREAAAEHRRQRALT